MYFVKISIGTTVKKRYELHVALLEEKKEKKKKVTEMTYTSN